MEETGMEKRKGQKRLIILLCVLAVLSLLLLAMIKGRSPTAGYEAKTVTTGDLVTYYHFSGTVIAPSRSTCTAAMPLTVQKLYRKSGDAVKKGDAVLRSEQGTLYKAGQDGTLGELTLSPGQSIPQGGTLFTVADYDTLVVRLLADEQDAAALTVGAEVTVDFQALHGQSRKGEITYISREAEKASGGIPCYSAHVTIEDTTGLLCGMTAHITLEKDRAEHAVLIENAAVMTDESNNPYVYYVKNGRMAAKYIALGHSDGTLSTVTAGLKEGETVYTPIQPTAAADPMALLREEP